MAVHRSLLIDSLAAIALRPRSLSLLTRQSILLRSRTERGSSWSQGSKPGELLKRIAAVGEREPGVLLRGIAAVGAGNQSTQHCQHAHHDRNDPCHPDGRKATQSESGRALHHWRTMSRVPNFRIGEIPHRKAGPGVKSLPRLESPSRAPNLDLNLRQSASPVPTGEPRFWSYVVKTTQPLAEVPAGRAAPPHGIVSAWATPCR